MSFLKKLFGGGTDGEGGKSKGAPRVMGEESYQGFTIRAIEMKAGSEFQLCGEIEKEIDGETKLNSFIRADKLGSEEHAVSITLSKGRQVIDEQGEKLFG